MLILLLLGCECKGDTCFRVENGYYYGFPPSNWDGASELSAVMMFHGYGGSARQYYEDQEVMADFSAMEVLLLLPQGEGNSWSSNHSPEEDVRDDFSFIKAVWSDAEGRWPVSSRYVMGFSHGSSMAAGMAAEAGEMFAGMAAMSGGFWEPLPEECPEEVPAISHTHGTADQTWPIEGRTLSFSEDDVHAQAPLEENLEFWRGCSGCSDAVSATWTNGELSCEQWSDCTRGGPVRVCLHPQGHTRIDGWVEQQVSWLLHPR